MTFHEQLVKTALSLFQKQISYLKNNILRTMFHIEIDDNSFYPRAKNVTLTEIKGGLFCCALIFL